jgi:glucokinase
MMGRYLLVGDVGATKAILGVASGEPGRVTMLEEATFSSRDYATLEHVVREFLQSVDLPIAAACFSVAGPVVDGQVWFPNLNWHVSEAQLCKVLNLAHVVLVNDLQATAMAIPYLSMNQLATLQIGVPDPHGVRAVIATGTGLGEAMLIPDGAGYKAYPSEGGHTDFAPNGTQQIELLSFLHQEFGHVSYERVCSGPGIANIYRFLRDVAGMPEPAWLRQQLAEAADPTPLIVAAGLDEPASAICKQTLELFGAILGAETGNLALRALAGGGVYVGGGIPPRILPVLRSGVFLQALRRKGPMSDLARRMPVHVILEPRAALLGAAHYALHDDPGTPLGVPVGRVAGSVPL